MTRSALAAHWCSPIERHETQLDFLETNPSWCVSVTGRLVEQLAARVVWWLTRSRPLEAALIAIARNLQRRRCSKICPPRRNLPALRSAATSLGLRAANAPGRLCPEPGVSAAPALGTGTPGSRSTTAADLQPALTECEHRPGVLSISVTTTSQFDLRSGRDKMVLERLSEPAVRRRSQVRRRLRSKNCSEVQVTKFMSRYTVRMM